MASPKKFKTTIAIGEKGSVFIPVPFDPDVAWGIKARHHVNGIVDGKKLRGVVERGRDGYGITMGPAWARDCGVALNTMVEVVIKPEGPQRADLAPDIVAALAANPKAAEFFDSLAQFYRKAYLTWIDATKKRPELRVERIAEMVKLLRAGKKERPKP